MLRIALSLLLVIGVAGVASAQQYCVPGQPCPNCPPVVVTPRVTVYPAYRPYYPRPVYRPVYRPYYVVPYYYYR